MHEGWPRDNGRWPSSSSWSDQEIRKIYDLAILLNDCSMFDREFHSFLNHAMDLNPFLTESRYPEDALSVAIFYTAQQPEK